MTKATNAANYLFWLEQLQPTIRETERNVNTVPTCFDSVEMDHVQFSYPMRPRARILRDINLKVSRYLSLTISNADIRYRSKRANSSLSLAPLGVERAL